MGPHRAIVLLCLLMAVLGPAPPRSRAQEASATASRRPAPEAPRRLRVRIEAVDLGRRDKDERPAEFRLVADDFGRGRRIDLASLRVVRCDPEGGEDLSGPLPLRWYDDAIPYDF